MFLKLERKYDSKNASIRCYLEKTFKISKTYCQYLNLIKFLSATN